MTGTIYYPAKRWTEVSPESRLITETTMKKTISHGLNPAVGTRLEGRPSFSPEPTPRRWYTSRRQPSSSSQPTPRRKYTSWRDPSFSPESTPHRRYAPRRSPSALEPTRRRPPTPRRSPSPSPERTTRHHRRECSPSLSPEPFRSRCATPDANRGPGHDLFRAPTPSSAVRPEATSTPAAPSMGAADRLIAGHGARRAEINTNLARLAEERAEIRAEEAEDRKGRARRAMDRYFARVGFDDY